MRIDVIRYEPHTSSLRPFKFFYKQLRFIDSSSSAMRKNDAESFYVRLPVHYGGCFGTLNLLHVSSCKMFTFYDVLHETKQKRKQTLERAQYGLDIIYKYVTYWTGAVFVI